MKFGLFPCGDGRSDKKLKTSGENRLAMVNLILKDIIDEFVPIKVNNSITRIINV